uniref:Auxin-responsive protein n=1 Tax=Oryza nivara TaxID=4536 RepID=A0A0E0IN74_ORYNI
MIHPKKLAQLAKKLQQRMVSSGGGRHTAGTTGDCCSTASSSLAGKGHCAVYTADGARFEVPLPYLGTPLFGELLAMSQEEFGFAGDDGRITLTCDASVMEYVMCLISRDASEEVERAFLSSMSSSCHNVGFSQKASKSTMISAKKLAQLAKKLQMRMASAGGSRQKAVVAADDCCSTASLSLAGKGHCAVYTADGARFEVPLPYLGTPLFGELLTMSREEFGFAGDDGRITLPCDASVMEYVMCLLSRDASEEVERAFLSSMARPCRNIGCLLALAGGRRWDSVPHNAATDVEPT